MKWKAITPGSVHLRRWDDEWVVYNAASGETHLVGAAAGHILALLRDGPSDNATLTRSVVNTGSLEPGARTSFLVADILADLQRCSLIEGVD
jgi:PqqD family protein of HPr-rel-A system